MVLLIVDKRYLRKKNRYINNLEQKIAKWERLSFEPIAEAVEYLEQKIAKWERLSFEPIAEAVEYHVWEQQRGQEQSCIRPFWMSFQDPLLMVISNR